MHRFVVFHSPRHLKTNFKQKHILLWTRLAFILLLEKIEKMGEEKWRGGGGDMGKS
jgi:hypothetical protein